ncbi:hypothetical protein GW17_00000289 [Ensete ventricosum]|uniref:Uncharacterized protein n=1 Tax=Ensete ventricosum TaxID=4639 RepID=A0A426XDH8_ENSVE|nr:hypothetical protein B296_00044917 [Ensete ventricosum]RWW34949.1 hypothetical protein GW17_00000289 [Ensete ventricosum]
MATFDPMGNVPSVSHQAPTAAHHTVFLSPMDHTRNMLMRQIEYYFSRENLCKDSFLRINMDGQGWIPVSLIASFNRVSSLWLLYFDISREVALCLKNVSIYIIYMIIIIYVT